MMKGHKNSILFRPFEDEHLSLKNRVIMAPMTTRYADENGHVTAEMVAHYSRRARGGVGLVIIESTSVHPTGRGWLNNLSAEDDDCIPGLTTLCTAIHEAEATVLLQLFHPGRQTRQSVLGTQPVAPSPIPCPRIGEMPKELTITEIQDIIQSFIQSARRAMLAGFDGIELHAAHGYLINQFLSPSSNKRTDKYGGLDGGLAFLRDLIIGIRDVLGLDKILSVRISGEEFIPDGIHCPSRELEQVVQVLNECGVDLIHVSATVYGSYPQWVGSMPAGSGTEHFVPIAKEVRRLSNCPVVTAGRILAPAGAEAILNRGDADFVALGRALLADAEWVQHARDGDQIRPCIGCGGCNARTKKPEIVCLADPNVGHEAALKRISKHIHEAEKLTIIGGSILARQLAIYWKRRGWDVDLYRGKDDLGGLVGARSAVPGLEEFGELSIYLKRLCDSLGVVETVVDRNYWDPSLYRGDVLPDSDLGHIVSVPPAVYTANSQLSRHIHALEVWNGHMDIEHAVVIGEGLLAIDTAILLRERGIPVTILGSSPELVIRAHPTIRHWRLKRLEEYGVSYVGGKRIEDEVDAWPGATWFSAPDIHPADDTLYGTDEKPSLHHARNEPMVFWDYYDPGDATHEVWRALKTTTEQFLLTTSPGMAPAKRG